MSQHGRADSVSLPVARRTAERDDIGAAGTFLERPVGTKMHKPIDPIDIEGLRRLIEYGKLIRREDGSYGTTIRTLVTLGVARRLKARDLAVAGFNREIVPTDKGRRVHAEAINAVAR